MVKKYLISIFIIFIMIFSSCGNEVETKLLYQGHASFRITSKNGTVIYIDPFAGEGYDLPADIILVTHEHRDHNQINLVSRKENCVVITNNEAQKNNKYNTFRVKGVKIEAVEAYNASHPRTSGSGYIITVDGIKIYHSSDTGKTSQMETFPKRKLDYALLQIAGIPETVIDWAETIKAKHSIPMHTSSPGVLFSPEIAERFKTPSRLIVLPGEEIILKRL